MRKEKRLTRGAGILLAISNLPSCYGIGSFGKTAYEFVDFLKSAGQRYWQVLPLGPTGYGDSPYQSFSAFAGNPYYIDLPQLFEQGLLTAEELHDARFPQNDRVDYEWLYRTRFSVLRTAASRFSSEDSAFCSFAEQEGWWLDDYALFMTAKERFGQREWQLWDVAIRRRDAGVLEEFRKRWKAEIFFWKCCQFWFYTQWLAVKRYANDAGVQIIGDIPIYVSADSADVWAQPSLFYLDKQGYPAQVAGVPPDAFSPDGQRWGNPLYRYEVMEQDGFSWWKRRMEHCARLYDVVRVDHFIGFCRYYAIPATSDSAAEGEWHEAPGKRLTDALDSVSGNCKIIAEDLGVIHPSVRRLLRQTGYPGMRILQFAFDGDPQNEYLPHCYTANTLVYGGTHDNETLVGFCGHVRGKQKRFMLDYLAVKRMDQVPQALVRAAYGSVADVAIFQMQDVLCLDNSARMNTPSTLGGNWCWRMKSEQLTDASAQRLRRLSEIYGRG